MLPSEGWRQKVRVLPSHTVEKITESLVASSLACCLLFIRSKKWKCYNENFGNMRLDVIQNLYDLAASSHRNPFAHHKRDVDSPDDVNLWVSDGLLRHKDKSLWVQGVNLGAIFQEGYIFPWPVLPGVDRTFVSYSKFLLFWFHTSK